MTFYRATVNNSGAMLIMHRKGGEELRDTGKEKFTAENHNKIKRYKYFFLIICTPEKKTYIPRVIYKGKQDEV